MVELIDWILSNLSDPFIVSANMMGGKSMPFDRLRAAFSEYKPHPDDYHHKNMKFGFTFKNKDDAALFMLRWN